MTCLRAFTLWAVLAALVSIFPLVWGEAAAREAQAAFLRSLRRR